MPHQSVNKQLNRLFVYLPIRSAINSVLLLLPGWHKIQSIAMPMKKSIAYGKVLRRNNPAQIVT